ncbi:hypothetical protein CVT24_006314 [Panaeolus cyanescens]|uniref:Uncharacterized protein n=1 Tax=Panaeolus cyanescens TaxID=181874 RepID=A0A409YEC9_9AGAR|nr:hypothetical protein CVT24_006314 [Panaeolus cyanescens]
MANASNSHLPPPSFVTFDGVNRSRTQNSPYGARSLPPAFSDIVLSTRSMRPASTIIHGPSYQARDPFQRPGRRQRREERLTFDDIPTGTRADYNLTPHHTRGSFQGVRPPPAPVPQPRPASRSDEPYHHRPPSSVGTESVRIPFQTPLTRRSQTLESSYLVREGKRPEQAQSSDPLPPAYSTDNLSCVGYFEDEIPYPREKFQNEAQAGPSTSRRSYDSSHQVRPDYYAPPPPTASAPSITPPSYFPYEEHNVSTGNISELPRSEVGTFGARKPSIIVQTLLFILSIPSQIYLNFLLRLPSLYFSRVARIFEEADLTLPEIKKMAFETAFRGKLADSNSVQRALEYAMPIAGRGTGKGDAPAIPVAYECLKASWEFFIDSLMREWKTFNIISVLLLSAILTILQIEEAAADPITRYAALHSLICALVSLLFGCSYIIRFGTMRKTYKAAEWALEAQKSSTTIWWNVWILLAMPAIWLAWSLMMYLVCIMSFIWRTGNGVEVPALSSTAIFAFKIFISSTLGLGMLYGILIIHTFRRYGQSMDRRWKRRIDEWIREMNETGAGLNATEQGMGMMGTGMTMGYPYYHRPQYTGANGSAMSMGVAQQSRRASYHSAFVAGPGPVPAPLMRTHAFERDTVDVDVREEDGEEESLGTPPQITVQPTSTASQPSVSDSHHDESGRESGQRTQDSDVPQERAEIGFGLPRSASPLALEENVDNKVVLGSEIPSLATSSSADAVIEGRPESLLIEYADDTTYPTEIPTSSTLNSTQPSHTQTLSLSVSTPPPALLSPVSPSFDKTPVLCTPLEPVKVINVIHSSSSSAAPEDAEQRASNALPSRLATFDHTSTRDSFSATTHNQHQRFPSSSSPFNPFRLHQTRAKNMDNPTNVMELDERSTSRNPWLHSAAGNSGLIVGHMLRTRA